MLWKSVTALIVLFWAVMTVLLVQHTYFPDEGLLSEVPVESVLRRVVQNRQPMRNTLQLLQGDKRIGHADLSISEWREPLEPKQLGWAWQAGGMVDGAATGTPDAHLSWRFEGRQAADQTWDQISLAVRATATDTNLFTTDTNLFVSWKRGQESPTIEVRRAGKLIMDTQAALEQAKKEQGIAGGLTSFLPGFMGSQKLSLERSIHLVAHESRLTLAGKPRKGYTLTLSLLSLYQAKAHYTEAGELTRIDLPRGLVLIDPLLEGLDR